MDHHSRLAVLFIPEGSRFEKNLVAILKPLKDVGLSPKVYKDADSQNIEIFLYFREAIDTDLFSDVLCKYLASVGIAPAPDTLTISNSATCIPVPLQTGFAWLSHSGQVIIRREEISMASALALLTSDIEKNAVHAHQILNVLQEQQVDHLTTLLPAEEVQQCLWGQQSSRFHGPVSSFQYLIKQEQSSLAQVHSLYSLTTSIKARPPPGCVQYCLSFHFTKTRTQCV